MTPKEVLSKYFGYESFRAKQEEIIRTVLSKRDCMVLMPTGGGKSVCFQVPALMMQGVTIVVSPLIALMKDQVDALKANGIAAALLNSNQSQGENQSIINDLMAGNIKLLYIAPERLCGNSYDFFSLLKNVGVSLFAIDEAHCISHWGHDFRPDYLMLSRIKETFPDTPVVALTATADELTRKEIVNKLQLKNPEVFVSSFNRANIRYTVDDKNDYYRKITDFLEAHPNDAGIIYCLSRQNTEDLAEKLAEEGFNVAAYHAGLNAQTRTERQEQFKRDEVQIIVATIAFGMGIDKSNVRFVIHANLPKNIESYYQETGRAGRDGLASQAILFYSAADVMKLKNFAQSENPVQTRVMLKKLDQMEDYCRSLTCRRKFLLNYFSEEFSPPCNNCDVCLNKHKLELFDGTVIAQKALSAITRLNEKFGVTYVINFLKGSESAKIHDRHKDLPTYGKGKEFSADEWRFYFRQLLDQHFVEAYGEFSQLRVTASGKDVLYRGEKVLLQEFVAKQAVRKERRENYKLEAKDLQYDKQLFEELRALRSNIARDQNVPPYVIFPDTTLAELATYLPTQYSDLPHISGFGEIKIEKYGELFLAAVNSYCRRNSLHSRMSEKAPLARTKKVTVKKSANQKNDASRNESFRLYSKGLTPSKIASERGLTEGTIMEHLFSFIYTGELNVLKFVSKEKLANIINSIRHHGDAKLSVLKNDLGDNYSYDEIRAAVQYWRKGKKQ